MLHRWGNYARPSQRQSALDDKRQRHHRRENQNDDEKAVHRKSSRVYAARRRPCPFRNDERQGTAVLRDPPNSRQTGRVNPSTAPWSVVIKRRSEERRVGKECRSRW